MSVAQSGFSRRGPAALALNIAPRFASFPPIECPSSNKENCPEPSTPQLPKKTAFNSKPPLSLRKSNFSSQQCPQESENAVDISFDKASSAEFQMANTKEPKSALFRKKEAEMSFCGDSSPLVLDDPAPVASVERDFNEELYKRAEEYLDSLHFVIVLPEDHRRRPFGNLRVSTAKAPLSDAGNLENNSPGLISPSIHTSSLFQRRSSSKKVDSDSTPAKQKLALAKSPFYNLGKGKRLFVDAPSNKDAGTENDDDSGMEKSPLTVVTSLNVKFTGMSLRASREPSDGSCTSFKMEEDSPLKIVV